MTPSDTGDETGNDVVDTTMAQDVRPDTGPADVLNDTGIDAGHDTGTDVLADLPVDAGMDVPVDRGPDVPVDSGADVARDTGVDVPVGLCPIAADWMETFMGMTVYYRFSVDNTWQGAVMRSDLGGMAAILLGNYMVSGGHVLLNSDPGMSGCRTTDSGDYVLSFTADCNGMTWTVVTDTCAARSMAISGNPFTRL